MCETGLADFRGGRGLGLGLGLGLGFWLEG